MAEADDLELAALLCSRVCHDIIGPVGAISNGFEVLDEEDDPSVREMALDVIRKNARKASVRLQFSRLAFGAMGAAGARVAIDEARRLTEALFEGEKVAIAWPPTDGDLPKEQIKLLVNLVTIAAQAVPRGGEVTVEVAPKSEIARIRLVARGERPSMPTPAGAILTGNAPDDSLDAHAIQPHYTARLAEAIGATVTIRDSDDAIEIVAERAE